METTIKITKLTNEELLRKACESTFNGTSKQTLFKQYRSEESPARTQIFWIELDNLPLFVSTHLIRHHVGSQPFALTHRVDRKGGGDITDLVDRLASLLYDKNESESESDKDIIDAEIDNILKGLKDGGRNTPTRLGLLINAQSLIDMSKLRLCTCASKETQEAMKLIKRELFVIDSDLAIFLVPKCIYRNGLCEKKCKYYLTERGQKELKSYQSLFL